MFRHFAKLIGFWGLQAGLFWGLLAAGGDEERPSSKSSLASAPVEEQLVAYVKSKVRPLWNSNPQVIELALLAGENQGLIAVLVDQFNAGPNNYLAAAYDKDRRLRTAPGERLILVGGSNVALSMDSRLLEERYGLAPVNMGLQAPLGIRFMTRHVAEHVRPGDVVILLIEYAQMWRDPDGQGRAPTNFCRTCPELAWLYHPETKPGSEHIAICWDEWKQYGDHEALADLAKTARQGVQQLRPDPPPTAEQMSEAAATAEFERCIQPLLEAAWHRFVVLDRVYLRSGFNRYGDMTRHRREAPSGRNPHFEGEFEYDRIAQLERGIRILNDFADHCHDVGATVYFSFPPVPRRLTTEQLAAEYEAHLQASLEFPILFPIEDAFIENGDLYDTAYHLTWHGTCKRMQALCNGLDRVLTPQTPLSVKEHIAARDRAVSRSIAVATMQERSQRL